MPPDASDTKRRILAAARREFALYGLAGARIDRIAEHARANKRSIYMHFGPKEELFDIVAAGMLAAMAESVRFDPDDLPGYAIRLHDYLLADPDTLRVTTWANLERGSVTSEEVASYREKLEALEDRFGSSAAEVLTLVLGLVTSSFHSSPALAAAAGPDAAVPREFRRALLRESVAAVVAAGQGWRR